MWAEERFLGDAGRRHISEYAILPQVHTFDPFLSTGTEAAVQGRPGLQFHPVGILGSADGRVGSGGPEHWQSLENIMTDMGHEWLEVTNKLPVDEKAQTFVFPAAREQLGQDEMSQVSASALPPVFHLWQLLEKFRIKTGRERLGLFERLPCLKWSRNKVTCFVVCIA